MFGSQSFPCLPQQKVDRATPLDPERTLWSRPHYAEAPMARPLLTAAPVAAVAKVSTRYVVMKKIRPLHHVCGDTRLGVSNQTGTLTTRQWADSLIVKCDDHWPCRCI